MASIVSKRVHGLVDLVLTQGSILAILPNKSYFEIVDFDASKRRITSEGDTFMVEADCGCALFVDRMGLGRVGTDTEGCAVGYKRGKSCRMTKKSFQNGKVLYHSGTVEEEVEQRLKVTRLVRLSLGERSTDFDWDTAAKVILSLDESAGGYGPRFLETAEKEEQDKKSQRKVVVMKASRLEMDEYAFD